MPTVESDDLDADVARVIAALEAQGLPAWRSLSIPDARELEADVFAGTDHPPVQAIRDFAIDGPDGDIPVRAFHPPSTDPASSPDESASSSTDPASSPDEPASSPDESASSPDESASSSTDLASSPDESASSSTDLASSSDESASSPDRPADSSNEQATASEGSRTDGDSPAGVLVFLHGGLFVLGTLDTCGDICREFATRTGCVVLAVDYRRAPEHPFPAAVDDASAAVEYAIEHATEFGVDPGAVGVVGTSAGGALAGATAIRAARDDTDLAVQVLSYPMLTATAAYGDDPFESYREHATAPLLEAADVAWGWRHYLPDDEAASDPAAAPLGAAAGQLADTAPAVVATAGVDVLRDEGAAYARKLADADVPVTHAHYPTLAHGFCSMTREVPLAADAFEDIATAIDEQLE